MYGRNDAAAKALGERNWYYRKTFSYGGPGESVRLCFDGVADRCRIYLNGEEIGSHQGMFGGPIPWTSRSMSFREKTHWW